MGTSFPEGVHGFKSHPLHQKPLGMFIDEKRKKGFYGDCIMAIVVAAELLLRLPSDA